MRFIDRYGEELITIKELFASKQFIRGVNDYYLFSDYTTQENEIWSFAEDLHKRIPFNVDTELLKEICLQCG